MFGLNFVQVLLILFITAAQSFDLHGPQTMIFSTILVSVLVGAVCGDTATGLYIGATLQLMGLGVVGLGGASVPDFVLTAIVTTIVAIQTGQGYEIGMTIGLPVGMLSIYLDVFVKTVGVSIQQHSQKLVNEGKFDQGVNFILTMTVLNVLRKVIPVFIILIIGQAASEAVVNLMPAWLYNGLQVAGKLLPATGMAILMNYMPIKRHWPYFLLGFVLFSYFGATVFSTSLIGIALAVVYYNQEMKAATAPASAVIGGMEDE